MSDEAPSLGKQLESLDGVEDAIACLKSTGLQYLLLVGTHSNGTSFYSDLTNDKGAIILQWIEDGRLNQYVAEHIAALYSEE